MKFNEQLMNLRKQQGLSQEQLGEKIGVSRQTVSKWELGDTTPELEKLILLSDFFNISIDMLTGKEKTDPMASPSGFNRSGNHNPYAWHYEYKSRKKLWGLPLLHVNIGPGIHKAKGIVAIGTLARGIISAGVVSAGVISLGAASLGLLSIGAVSIGALLSIGGLSLGTISIGGLSIGIFAVGGCALGIYSIGGCAIAAKIAGGGYANAPIAIGDKTNGQLAFDIHQQISAFEIRSAILKKFPQTWKIIVDIFSNFS